MAEKFVPPCEGLPPPFTPDVLNELFLLHRKTDVMKQEEVLQAALRKMHMEHHYKKLTEVFATVLGASYVFLDAYPGGAKSSDQLWAENRAEIRKWSPWLDDDNFAWAEHQSGYYAWHDGLVKSY
jgi:hypothetical protein